MPCTTILVGKNASCDGSTLMARNEDSSAGKFDQKRFIVVKPEDQPRHYVSVKSKLELELPEEPLRYTAMPNAQPDEGIWAAAGVNACNVAMTATETISSNPRVLGADPLVKKGIGEEDLVTLTLPYIRSAREGVLRLGKLHERYGTYEMNGIGLQDAEELWWFETVGGHHWIARRVPDDCYIVMPNQQGIDRFDFVDAFGEQREHLCSADLLDFIRANDLDRTMNRKVDIAVERAFDVRGAFGSRDDADRIYNTPRAWAMLRYLNPGGWEGTDRGPESISLPWCMVPERRVTVEEVKYLLSYHYQGTPYDPYARYGDASQRGMYRPIGINRNNVFVLTQLRGGVSAESMALEWVAFGSNVFNAMVPFYANVETTPDYFSYAGKEVSTESFYWASRMIAALADAHYAACAVPLERYQSAVAQKAREFLHRCESGEGGMSREAFNQRISDMVRRKTDKLLSRVLYEASFAMKNNFSRSDM